MNKDRIKSTAGKKKSKKNISVVDATLARIRDLRQRSKVKLSAKEIQEFKEHHCP
jgi:hypothetical protein